MRVGNGRNHTHQSHRIFFLSFSCRLNATKRSRWNHEFYNFTRIDWKFIRRLQIVYFEIIWYEHRNYPKKKKQFSPEVSFGLNHSAMPKMIAMLIVVRHGLFNVAAEKIKTQQHRKSDRLKGIFSVHCHKLSVIDFFFSFFHFTFHSAKFWKLSIVFRSISLVAEIMVMGILLSEMMKKKKKENN